MKKFVSGIVMGLVALLLVPSVVSAKAETWKNVVSRFKSSSVIPPTMALPVLRTVPLSMPRFLMEPQDSLLTKPMGAVGLFTVILIFLITFPWPLMVP